MQRKLGGQHFEQRLRPAGTGQQLGQRLVSAGERRAADAFGHDPHAALRHRVGEIGLGHLAIVIEGTAPQRPAQGLTKPRATGTRDPPPPLKAETRLVRKDMELLRLMGR